MLVRFCGERLREERKRRGLSQAALAIRADSSIRHIRALETGKKCHPSAELLCKIADVLNVPMETFMLIEYEESDALYAAEWEGKWNAYGKEKEDVFV